MRTRMATALLSAFVAIGCGPARYTVSYDGNGNNVGTAPMDSASY